MQRDVVANLLETAMYQKIGNGVCHRAETRIAQTGRNADQILFGYPHVQKTVGKVFLDRLDQADPHIAGQKEQRAVLAHALTKRVENLASHYRPPRSEER